MTDEKILVYVQNQIAGLKLRIANRERAEHKPEGHVAGIAFLEGEKFALEKLREKIAIGEFA